MFEHAKRLLLIVVSAVALNAQHSHHSPAPTEKPVTLLGSLGPYSHRIITSSPESQNFFDQGLRLLYGFNRYEALRSFRRAAELDPEAAMPMWGVAMALGPHINMDSDGDFNAEKSCAALSKAKTLGASRSSYEKAYVAAVASRCPAYDPERYIEGM